MAMRSIAQRMLQIAGRRDHKFQSFAAISSDSRSLAPAIDLKVDAESSASAAAASSSSDWATSMEICGRGDKKTKRGKRFKGSFGNARPKMKKKIERIKDKLEVPRSTPWPLPFKLI